MPSRLELTDSNFESEVLKSEVPVLVHLVAGWAERCHTMRPTVDSLGAGYAGRAKVAQLDVDEAPRAAIRCRIRNLPTILVYNGGAEVDRRSGQALSKEELAGMLDRAIG